MKKSKFTEAQIVFAIKQFETGTRVDDISRLMVISQATFFNWKKQYGRWVVYQNSEIRHERQTQKIYQQLLRRPQMKPEEKIAERFLSEQSLGRIIYEPKGQRTPDFSINDEIGVEVRRLNKHLKATPLEKLQFDIIPKLESLFKSYYERSHTKSYFIMIDFKRPLKATKNVLGQVKSILDNHSEDMEGTCEYEVSDNLTIAIIPSTERFDHKFVFGSSTDFDRAGFTISDIIDSLNIIVPEKARIVEPHINDFKKWWLILVDHIGYVPVEIEMENLRQNFSLTHPFERIYLISPIDPKIGTFL